MYGIDLRAPPCGETADCHTRRAFVIRKAVLAACGEASVAKMVFIYLLYIYIYIYIFFMYFYLLIYLFIHFLTESQTTHRPNYSKNNLQGGWPRTTNDFCH